MSALSIGNKAPQFAGVNQAGKQLQLADYAGKKVVLYFYPKDNTPGCTAQACNLRDNYTAMQAQGYVVIGVSADDATAHLKFIAKYELPFDLIADTDKTICTAYGVWGPKKFMGKTYDGITRTTFVLDENGIIIDIIAKVNTKEHTAQIIK
ncbi:MAG: thioredoxin-dependent thiol peroxidase [Bacteroidia bacterium]